jgi:two-component system osmolarity sensor histidine kinase EnvZ
MAAFSIRRWLPQALFGRALIILLTPVVVMQGVVAAGVFQRHYEGVTNQLATTLASELNYAVDLVETAPDVETAEASLAAAREAFAIGFVLEEGELVARDALRAFYDVTGGVLEETLKSEVRRPMALDLLTVEKFAVARLQTSKGVLEARVQRDRLSPSNPHQIFVWMATSSLALVTVAAIFLRNQVRPIRELAAAAEAFGKGRALAFRPSGAEEVRRAGAAFLDMRARIERQIESRTLMLSGVSHDMRTPLTRMKLALEMMEPGPDRDELIGDVLEMERMLGGFLAFARDATEEAAETVDLPTLAEEVAGAARRAGARVTVALRLGEPPVAILRRDAMRRALGNLVENAAKHGRQIALSLRRDRRWLYLEVEDDGPGIPEQDRATAVLPFSRLDAARNPNAGGVGLGLSIAADVARAHGGALTLDESPQLGGLCARIRIPR